MNKTIEDLRDKKILILGFAREGQSTHRFLRKFFPDKLLGIADQERFSKWDQSAKNLVKVDKHRTLYAGNNYLKSLRNYHIVFKSPGIPSKLIEIKRARERGVTFTSQTKLFFDLCKGKIIGVTGTKGKSTTATLIYQIIKRVGFKAVILGNIGKPCLDYLSQDFGVNKYFVFELSSHQLSDLNKSPHIAVWLNLYKEHLDYYGNFRKYFEAKKNVTKFQAKEDYLIYNNSQVVLQNVARKAKPRTLGFSSDKEDGPDCFLDGNYIFLKSARKKERVIRLNQVPLLGEHNINNVMAAILVAKVLNVPTKKIGMAITNFRPLEHRLEKVGIYNGITFIDDSLATIPEATIAAIEALKGKVGTLILGGSDRGQDYKELAAKILEQKVDNVILFPVTGKRIWQEISKKKSKYRFQPRHFFANDMRKAVALSFANTRKDKICLLSTASPSFSLFRDYKEKATLFRECISNYESHKGLSSNKR